MFDKYINLVMNNALCQGKENKDDYHDCGVFLFLFICSTTLGMYVFSIKRWSQLCFPGCTHVELHREAFDKIETFPYTCL